MNLAMNGGLAAAYVSGAQRARVVTEAWGKDNLYCPNCTAPNLARLDHNTKVSDYSCPSCQCSFQLKGQKTRFGNSISDGAYGAMIEAIRRDETPSFFFMEYDLASWRVKNLLLVPSFAFPESAVVERRPLAPTARRAGWIGCNIALNRIPAEARISVVADTLITPEHEVRARFSRIRPLREIRGNERGWTLDVLRAVRSLGKIEFTNEEAYTLVPQLQQQHPGNRHVRDKIRQKLQVLRDAGLLIHLERGRWRLLEMV